MLGLRPMTEEDLSAVAAWLVQPHVARWWTPDTTAAEEIAKYRRRISPQQRPATVMLMVTWDGAGIGWCQWYRWADYPAEAVAMAARDGEVGIDYAIGDPGWVGHRARRHADGHLPAAGLTAALTAAPAATLWPAAHVQQPLLKLGPSTAPLGERAEDLLERGKLLIERGQLGPQRVDAAPLRGDTVGDRR
jgi:Acetyltransferase (GNAT) domain